MTRFTAEKTLGHLKDFQRNTVEHVFRRLYLDAEPTQRYLVADEVGLGKTLVARGVIAKTLEHLQDTVERVDFVYVCSNAAIAHQNVRRLNVSTHSAVAMASRLTLLPTSVDRLRENKVNFVSFTPGTTFDLKSRSGIMFERSILYRMLRNVFPEAGLFNLLQGPAGQPGWLSAAKHWVYPLDDALSSAFVDAVGCDAGLRERVLDVSERFQRHREHLPWQDDEARYALIGDLRQRLAHVCLHALEPDLVILDEFQRFKNLLDVGSEEAELAQALFRYPNVRVLLLSATPYKMLSLDHERHEDHYPEFLQTLKFLLGEGGEVKSIERNIEKFRQALLDLGTDEVGHVHAARVALQSQLRAVMCRTERVGRTVRQDAMLSEPLKPAPLQPQDLTQARLVDVVTRQVGTRDAIEYWKSTPYALNLMKGYELRRRMGTLSASEHAKLSDLFAQHARVLLRREQFQDYARVDPANPRMRVLMADTVERGLWRVLWMPPSLPSWQPDGAFAGLESETKSLVFSAWNVVPDAIAALCSYEAERRMVAEYSKEVPYSRLPDAAKPLLRFVREPEERRSSMPALLLQYPSPTLASLVDPVAVGLLSADLPMLDVVLAHVRGLVAEKLQSVPYTDDPNARSDSRWYLAALAAMDGQFPGTRTWPRRWAAAGTADAEDGGTGRAFLAERLLTAMVDPGMLELGRQPDDIVDVLARLALASPAVCGLRSLHRAAVDLRWDDDALLDAANVVGEGFRKLFNIPESIALLRGDAHSDRYWMQTLEHALHGNLGALLDEQAHVLLESLGVADAAPEVRVRKIAEALHESLSIRTSQLTVDEMPPARDGAEQASFKLRCRFALRFGDMKDEKGEARTEAVRSAFNSPFRPFVLASTSVGQEGLDFHLWCHAVVHWNLPSNPVDLEQREGRVHRYKGHAVRKNVAKELGRSALRTHWQEGTDPWTTLFAEARKRRSGDLEAFWLFETENGATVERRVPLLPLSRDAVQLARLKRGLALYRLVFGQPRQEDLLAHLDARLTPEEVARVVAEWRVDLTPAGRD